MRAETTGLFLMATGPYLAWLSLTLLERLPGLVVQPLPVAIGRYTSRSGFVAPRAAEDLAPFRRFDKEAQRWFENARVFEVQSLPKRFRILRWGKKTSYNNRLIVSATCVSMRIIRHIPATGAKPTPLAKLLHGKAIP